MPEVVNGFVEISQTFIGIDVFNMLFAIVA
jgi:hypothetical protein